VPRRLDLKDSFRPSGESTRLPRPATSASSVLEARLCQVVGLNQNYTSTSGTPYHIQIEDRGPVPDRVSDKDVRRVNVIVYANYGEPNARIVHGCDHDFPDIRTQEHNRFIQRAIQGLLAEARDIIEENEQRQISRIKCLIREYYLTKDEAAKRQFAEANALFPFLFSRAWRELKGERPGVGPPPASAGSASGPAAEPVKEVVYPLDPKLRAMVIEIERIVRELGLDLQRLQAQGEADDILLQTCRKLVMRAKESLSGRDAAEFSAKRLDMTRSGLVTTWRQVRSRLR